MTGGAAVDPYIGRVIDGRYAIEGVLGEGGLGVVYRATQTRLGRAVAVKVLHPEHASTKQLRERFEREAKSLGSLVHPHIVQVIDYGLTDGAPYLVMELLEGKPLNEAIRDGVGLERALEIGRAIVAAVAYAHGRRVVHRDLKPANVFLQRGPEGTEIPRVLDFGLAKFLDAEPEGGDAPLTKIGTILGTPSYMSPEQASGAPSDARSDVYSLGIVLFELLTGARPFRGSPEELLRAHLFTEMPPLESVRPGIPQAEALDAVLRRASAKRSRDRYTDAGELLAALDALPPFDSAEPSTKVVAKVPPATDFTLDRTVMATPAARPSPEPAAELATSATVVPAERASAASSPRVPPAVATNETMALSSSALESVPLPERAAQIARKHVRALVVGGLVAALGLGALLAGGDEEAGAPETSANATTATVSATNGEGAPAADVARVEVAQPADEAPRQAAPLPPEIEEIVGHIRPGGRLGLIGRRRLNQWSRAHPGDPRAWIAMAHVDFLSGARTDALRWYENAVATNAHAADDPTLRRDVTIMAGHGKVGGQARAMVLRLFPRDAAAEIDAALREERLDDNERRRLEDFRASLR